MSVTVKIESLGAQGDGIAHHEGRTLYVPYTLSGETVEVDVKGKQAVLKKVVEPAPERAEAPCPHFGVCGGCALQHMSEEAYKTFKQQKVHHALQAAGLDAVAVEEVQLLPISSRRRTVLKAAYMKGKVQLGYYQKKTHNLINITSCLVLDPAINTLLEAIQKLLNSLLTKQKHTAEVSLTLTDSGVDLLLTLEKAAEIDLVMREKLAAFAAAHKLVRFVVKHSGFEDPIAMHSIPVVNFGFVPVEVSSGCFLQASKMADEMLFDLMDIQGKNLKIADLFCGRGTFSFPLADYGTVDAYEADRIALQAMQQAARQHKKPVEAIYLNLFQDPLSADALNKYDAVVLDPPRAGAEAQCVTLAASQVPQTHYVSCNVDSFARDAKTLVEGGYTLQKITPVDQFRYAHHIEVVALFTK